MKHGTIPLGDNEDADKLPLGHPRHPAFADAGYDGTHSTWGPLVYVALVLGIVAMLLGAFLMTVEQVIDHKNGATVDVYGSPSSPREQMARLTITTAANTALVPPAYTTPSSGFCVNASATGAFVVAETATSTINGDGPYCTDSAACPAGAVIPIAGRAWGRLAAGGPVVLSCRWVDDGNGFGTGGPRGTSGGPDACELTGGGDCQMDGQVRLKANGTSPQLTFHGTDGYGTAANYGVSKTGVLGIAVWANSLTNAVASFGPTQVILQSNTGQRFLQCVDGGYEYCDLLPSAAAGSYFTIGGAAQVRNNAGTAALPSYSFAGDLDSGMRYSSTGVGTVIVGNNTGDAALISTNSDVTLLSGDDTFITVGDDLNVLATGGSGNVDLHAMGALIVPLYITNGPTTLPPCAAVVVGDEGEGKVIYRDDKLDAVVGQPCFCVANAARTVFSWTNIGGGVCAP